MPLIDGRSRVQISPIPLFAGLAASCLLTVVCYLLVHQVPTAAPNHGALKSAGLLQWIYILGNAQAFPDKVVAVRRLTVRNLRQAGEQEIWNGMG